MSGAVAAGLLVGLAVLCARWPRRLPGHLAPARRAAAGPGIASGEGRCLGRLGRPGRLGPLGRLRPGRSGHQVDELTLLALAQAVSSGLAAGLDLERAQQLALCAAPPEVAEAFARCGDGAQDCPAAHAPEEIAGRDSSGRGGAGGGDAGRDFVGAAAAWAWVGRRSAVARSVAHALAVSDATGSPARAGLERAVQAGQEDVRRRADVDGAVAGARATGRILALLPLAGPFAVLALGLDLRTTYLDPVSGVSCAAGLALAGVGHLWLRRQVGQALIEEPAG